MFKEILISEVLPRDISALSSAFSEGLRMLRFFGYFFLTGALFLFSMSAFKFKMIVPSIIFVLLAVMGIYMVTHANKTIKMRKQAFLEGEVVIGTVEEHGRKFNPFKSIRDYTILVKIENESSQRLLKVVHKDKDLWISSPVGSEIIGLQYDGFYFFGEEIGYQLKLEKKNK